MAFDLCRGENLSIVQPILLRIMAVLGQTPLVNLVTISQYREGLVKAGYKLDNIEIRDISEHVFSPLAEFLNKRDREMQGYGMSLGRYSKMARLFKWWGSSAVIKGCIIVARK